MSALERLYRQIAHAYEGDPMTLIQRRQRWLSRFAPGERVLDLGCGDGYFMEMLRGAGIQSFGVECDPDKVAQVSQKGFHGFQGTFEAFFAVAAAEPEVYRFDGVFLGHVIEHCRPMDAVQLVQDCVGLLQPGGRIIILTPNIRHPTVQETFWLDISHERPYPKLLLEAMLRALGCLVESGELENGMEVFAIGTK